MMKKRFIVIIVLVALLAIGFSYGYCSFKSKQKAEEELKLEIMYEVQNDAFHLGADSKDSKKKYHSSQELELQRVAVNLYVYNKDQSKYTISLQDVIDYFNKEFADDGKLMISECPDSIKDYIEWYSYGGDEKIRSFTDEIILYMKHEGYDKQYLELSVEELEKIFPLVGDDAHNTEQSAYQDIIDSSVSFSIDLEAADLHWLFKETLFDADAQYTLDQVAQTIKGKTAYDSEYGDRKCQLIDCGMDGNQELLVEVDYKGNGAYLSTYMVIKKIGEEYRACYFADCSGTSEISINEYGFIGEFNNEGEGVTFYKYGFLDKDCVYNMYYNSHYYMLAYKYPGDITDSGDWDDMQIVTYEIPEEGSEAKTYCNYFKLDENFEAVEDESLYRADSTYRKAFEDAGVTVLTIPEAEELLKERRESIGLPDEAVG